MVGAVNKRPSGSALPPASQTPLPSAPASSEAGCPALSPWSLPQPSEGRDRSVEVEGVLRVGSREVSPPPSLRSVGGEGEGECAARALASAGDSAASSLPGEGVAGLSRSQESLVLADPIPVASSSPPGSDRRSRCGGKGGSTGDRSRSRSSRLSPPWGRASREEHLGARSRYRGASVWSWESRSRSTMDESALAVTCHAPLLPVCGLVAPGRGLLML